MSARHTLTILAVEDLAASKAFYLDAFGWPVTVDVPVYVELALPEGQRLGLYTRDAYAATVGGTVAAIGGAEIGPAEVYLYVDDLEAAIARVSRAGGRPLSPRAPRAWGDEAAYFADPSGHVLVVAQPR